jgi:hypothetical protein
MPSKLDNIEQVDLISNIILENNNGERQMKCRISGKETVEVFNLGELQMSDFVEGEEAPRTGKGELKLMLCEESGLLAAGEQCTSNGNHVWKILVSFRHQ